MSRDWAKYIHFLCPAMSSVRNCFAFLSYCSYSYALIEYAVALSTSSIEIAIFQFYKHMFFLIWSDFVESREYLKYYWLKKSQKFMCYTSLWWSPKYTILCSDMYSLGSKSQRFENRWCCRDRWNTVLGKHILGGIPTGFDASRPLRSDAFSVEASGISTSRLVHQSGSSP